MGMINYVVFKIPPFLLVYTAVLTPFSRKILFLFVCHSNSNPLIVGKMYLRYLFETEMLPRNLRVDRGTETGKMATIHVYLDFRYMKIHIFALRWKDEIRRSSQLRTLLKRVVVNRT